MQIIPLMRMKQAIDKVRVAATWIKLAQAAKSVAITANEATLPVKRASSSSILLSSFPSRALVLSPANLLPQKLWHRLMTTRKKRESIEKQ